MTLNQRIVTIALTLGLAAIMATPGYGQLFRRNRARVAPTTPAVTPGPVVPTPAVPEVGETPAETRREGREAARDVRAAARAAGETPAEARQLARETRQETRENIRAADWGVWFSTQANAQGLLIDDVTAGGVFASAGLRAGDVIVSIGGQPVRSEAHFVQFLSAGNFTGPVEVVVLRNGQRQVLVLQPAALSTGMVAYDPFYQYGIVIDDRRPNQIVILRVYPRTPAWYAGLRAGDVITTVGSQRVASVQAFSQFLSRGGVMLDVGITRGGVARQISLDGSSLNVNAGARTALRPNIDVNVNSGTATGATGSARTGARVGVDVDANAPAPGTVAPSVTTPAAPAAPATPSIPATPATPSIPATPSAPAAPLTPATPALPATPATPAIPATPATPAAPGLPDLP